MDHGVIGSPGARHDPIGAPVSPTCLPVLSCLKKKSRCPKTSTRLFSRRCENNSLLSLLFYWPKYVGWNNNLLEWVHGYFLCYEKRNVDQESDDVTFQMGSWVASIRADFFFWLGDCVEGAIWFRVKFFALFLDPCGITCYINKDGCQWLVFW